MDREQVRSTAMLAPVAPTPVLGLFHRFRSKRVML
jgi:hypothetical protein